MSPRSFTRYLALPATGATDVQPGEPWPLPTVDGLDGADPGPVMVIVRWPVARTDQPAFLRLARDLRRARQRTGATSWRLYRDAEDSNALVESFVLGSWTEHERQHARMSERDDALIDRLQGMTIDDAPRSVTHYLAIERR
jgi:hypothetical protein